MSTSVSRGPGQAVGASRCVARRCASIAAAVIAAWLLATTAAAVTQPPPQAPTARREIEVKAVFLFNFAQFVDWPPSVFLHARAPIVIGVLGDDPFGPILDEVVKGEEVKGRPLSVARFRRVEEVAAHILFITPGPDDPLASILAALKGKPVLTVSDTENFAVQGGMVRFFTDRNRVRLRINVDAAKAAGLRISSQLLRAAEIVQTPRDR